MESRQRRTQQIEEHWLQHVLACDRSGYSVKVYTQAHGLNEKTFYKWRQVLSQRGKLTELVTAPMFRRLDVVPASASQDEEIFPVPEDVTIDKPPVVAMQVAICCIRLPNGTALEVSGELSIDIISQLLRVAGTLPLATGEYVR